MFQDFADLKNDFSESFIKQNQFFRIDLAKFPAELLRLWCL